MRSSPQSRRSIRGWERNLGSGGASIEDSDSIRRSDNGLTRADADARSAWARAGARGILDQRVREEASISPADIALGDRGFWKRAASASREKQDREVLF